MLLEIDEEFPISLTCDRRQFDWDYWKTIRKCQKQCLHSKWKVEIWWIFDFLRQSTANGKNIDSLATQDFTNRLWHRYFVMQSIMWHTRARVVWIPIWFLTILSVYFRLITLFSRENWASKWRKESLKSITNLNINQTTMFRLESTDGSQLVVHFSCYVYL